MAFAVASMDTFDAMFFRWFDAVDGNSERHMTGQGIPNMIYPRSCLARLHGAGNL